MNPRRANVQVGRPTMGLLLRSSQGEMEISTGQGSVSGKEKTFVLCLLWVDLLGLGWVGP